jgi:hypothetical protein
MKMKKVITNKEHEKLNQILKDLEFRERPDNLKVFTKSPYYPIEKKV